MSTIRILSVTTKTGYDTIFRDTDFSLELGLLPGDMVPSEVLNWDVFLQVETHFTLKEIDSFTDQ